MTSLGLGDVARFPFVDPPDPRQVADGVRLLEELGAFDVDGPTRRGARRLTEVGRALARLPVDPRLGRMLLEAGRLGCTREVLVVVAPSAVTLHPERPIGSARNAWPLTVARLDEEPGRVRVVLDGPFRLVAEVTASAVTDLGLVPGTPIWAAVKATEVTTSNV